MGHFYTNATLMGPAGLAVAGAVGQMRRVAAITRNCGNFTVIFDRESEQQDGRAYPFMEQLTATLNCLGLYVTNHNDDVLYYRLYKSGIGRYNSCLRFLRCSRISFAINTNTHPQTHSQIEIHATGIQFIELWRTKPW